MGLGKRTEMKSETRLMKSEGRNPRAERRPKSETRIMGWDRIRFFKRILLIACRCACLEFRPSDFGLLSGFSLRVSGFI